MFPMHISLQLMLSDERGQMILLLTGLFALFAAMLIPAYFISMRPARGTIEWIGRVDKPEFSALRRHDFRWGDLTWALLTGFAAAMLRLTGYLLIYLRHNILQVFPSIIFTLSKHYLIPSALFAIMIYLLLRSMFDLTLPAVCCGVLVGLLQPSNCWAATLVSASMLFLWLWVTCDTDTNFLVHTLLLMVSVGLYFLLILRYWAMFWIAPLYIAAYIYVQVYRWRNGEKKGRATRLAVSLLLVFFAFIAAAAAGWAYYCVYKMNMPELLTDFRLMMEIVPERIGRRLSGLLQTGYPLATFISRDILMLLLGTMSLIPVIHGVFRWHDSHCIVLLALVLLFWAVWLLGGMYMLVPMLSLLLGWVLGIITEREQPWIVIVVTVVSAVTFYLEYFI